MRFANHRAFMEKPSREAGQRQPPQSPNEAQDQTPAERRAAMTWAQRLKRVFTIDVETCRACGGAVNVIACIEDPLVIEKILTHLKENVPPIEASLLPESRSPPQAGLFD